MQVRLYREQGNGDVLYALSGNNEVRFFNFWKDTLYSVDEDRCWETSNQLTFFVPEYSKLVFYLGEQIVGERDVRNSLLAELSETDILDEFYERSDLSNYFKLYMYKMAQEVFHPNVERYHWDFENSKLYGVVNGEYYECRAVLFNTIKLGIDGYVAYESTQDVNVAYLNAEEVDCTELVALYTPFGVGTFMIRKEDRDGNSEISSTRFRNLYELLRILKNPKSKIKDYVVGLPNLPIEFIVEKPNTIPTQSFTFSFSEDGIDESWFCNGKITMSELNSHLVNSYLPQLLQANSLVVRREHFVSETDGELCKIYMVNWIEGTFDSITDIATDIHGKIQYLSNTARILDEVHMQMVATAYFNHQAIPNPYIQY